jgi:uncharacterized delta-60 repeat protein
MKLNPFRNCSASLRTLRHFSTLRKIPRRFLFTVTHLAAFISLLLVGDATAVHEQSAVDGFDPNADEQVFAIVVQPDGKILVGGRFTKIAGGTNRLIARLNPDGTLDNTFKPNMNLQSDGTVTAGTVYAIALQPDGGILLGGDFSAVNGVTRVCLARLNSDGTLDTTFVEPNQRGTAVLSIAVQASGKILVGGRLGNNHFARLNTNGTVDSTFAATANSVPRSIVIQPDGRILIGGDFTIINEKPRNHIARLHPDGTLDIPFNPNASGGSQYGGRVTSVAVQADGKILIGGFFWCIGEVSPLCVGGLFRNSLARLNSDGTADLTFDPHPDGVILTIVVQADGRILVGGLSFTSIAKQSRNSIARLNPDGTADSFDPNAANVSKNPRVHSIAVQADGKILVGGDFTTLAPNGGPAVTRNYIARLEAEVRLDALNLGIVGSSVLATAVQPDGKILIGGVFSKVLGVTRNNIARLNGDGTLDLEFDPDANGPVDAIAVQADGMILVGGDFASKNGANSIGGQPRNRIARLSVSGVANSFNPDAKQSVRCIAVQANGMILVGGRFNGEKSIGGKTRNYIARLKPDGTVDTDFDPNANGIVHSIAVQADSVAVPVAERGNILVGGGFTTLQPNGATSATPRHYLARLKADGTLDPAFNPNANDAVLSIAVQADDGKILAGGLFSGLNSVGGNSGETRNYIARLNTDGTLDNALPFNPDANNIVVSIAVQTDRKIVVGGYFTGIGGQKRMGIARLSPIDGSADSSNPNANWLVCSIALQTDGKILAGGFFTTIDRQPRNLFARLTNDTAARQYLNVLSPTTVGWGREGSSPEVTRVTFESSSDNTNYTLLGSGTVSGSRWVLEGLSLPPGNVSIRARGHYPSGSGNGSESITESVRNVFIGVPPQCTPAPPGMVRWWPGDGKAVDIIGGNDGTLQGGATFTPGMVGQAFSFDGLDDFVQIPMNPSLFALTQGTLDMWVKIDNLNDNTARLFAIAQSGTVFPSGDQWTLDYRGVGLLETSLTSRGSLVMAAFTSAVITDNNFHHIAVVADGVDPIEIYVDGVSVPVTSTIATTADRFFGHASNANNMTIGAISRDMVLAEGAKLIDEVEIFDRPLTQSEIQNIYNAGPAGKCKPPIHHLGNISTRLRVRTGDNVGIGGFTITGSVPKHVLLRAIGPSLTQLGFPNVLADPVMELHGPTGFATITDDNWTDDSVQEALIRATGIPPTNNLESAIDATLAPGAYTAIIRGNGNTSGIALVEVYDLDHPAVSKLANISTRAFVSTGSDIVIAGFILESQGGDDRIVLRGIGPSLTALGLPDALANPTLELRDGNGELRVANDNWADDPVQAAQLTAAGLAPTNQLEAAISATLPAGLYTVLLAEKNNGAGVGLVEVYDLGAP